MTLNPMRILLLALLIVGSPAASQVAPAAPAAEEATTNAKAEPSIALESPDRDIRRRLRGLFAEIEGLEAVDAQVEGGVVTLSGTTLTVEQREEAENIASRLAGVVSVENEIAAEHRVGKRIQPIISRSREIGVKILSFLPLMLVAFAVFIAFLLFGRFLTRRTRLLKRLAPNPFIEALIAQVVRLVFILLGLVAAMNVIGATGLLGSILGAAGLLGLAIGFAVRDTIENYIASVLLSVRQPFAPNDHVIIQGYEGRITRLNSRATMLTTFDGNEVRIPNTIVYKAEITNFTRIPERRFMFEVGIGYENDSCCALADALAATKSVDGVMADPAPFVLIDRLGDYSVVLKIFGWVDQTKSDFGKVRSEAIRAVKQAFERNHISIPEPIQNIRRLPDPIPDDPPESRSPSAPEVEAVTDTRKDRTISEKVDELRADGKEDLLAHGAPTE